jgi:hypothetical protein
MKMTSGFARVQGGARMHFDLFPGAAGVWLGSMRTSVELGKSIH